MGKDNCPELSSSNWIEFSIRFKSVVAAKGYSNALTDSKSEHSDRVKGLLGQYVGREFLRLVDKASDAKAAWDQLKERFEQANTANAVHLQQQFTELQMEGGESITQYIDRALTLTDNLEATGNKVSDTQLAVQLLKGLPEQYDTIKKIITYADKLPDLTTIQQKLVLEEKQLQHSRPSRDTALYNRPGGWKGKGGGGSNDKWQRGRSDGYSSSGNRGRSHERHGHNSSRHSSRDSSHRGRSGSRGRHNNNNSSSSRFSGSCYHCGKRGHKKEDCWHRKGKEEEIALTCYALSQQAEAAGLDPNTDWIIDSGASSAVSGNKQLFSKLQSHTGNVDCGIGSGAATGRGTVMLQPNGSSIFMPISMSRVLYVPGYKYNLFPMRRLATTPGVKLEVQPDTLTIRLRDKVAAVAHIKGGLWVLQGSTALEEVAAACGETTPTASGSTSATTNAVAAAARVTPQEWHKRMGHLSYGSLAKMVERGMVTGVDVSPAQFRAAGETTCDICQRSKQAAQPFQPSSSSTSTPLELVHSDLCGPISPATPQGERYIFTLLDDFTGVSIVQLLKSKLQARTALEDGIALLERQSGKQLRQFRSDNGGEYVNAAVDQLLRSRGIAPQNSMPYTPQQNGKAERLNRTLLERIRAMLLESGLPKKYWGEAAYSAAFVRNRSPAAGKAATPYELFTGRKPDLSGLQPFGATAYSLIPKQQRGGKLADVSAKGTLLGYASNGAGYKVLLESGKVVNSRNVVFAKAGKNVTFDPSDGGSNHSDSDSDTPPGLDGEASDDDFADPESSDGGQDSSAAAGSAAAAAPPGPAAAAAGGQSTAAAEDTGSNNARNNNNSNRSSSHSRSQSAPPTPVRSSNRSNKGVPKARLDMVPIALAWDQDRQPTALAAAELIPEPKSFREATNSEQADMWWDAMDEEMGSLAVNGTWSLVDLPPDKVALPTMWAYKVKRDGQGNFERGKARLVAKGCRQVEGRDFDETFAPVSKYTTFRAVAAIAE
jgi:transposase InsO family protein